MSSDPVAPREEPLPRLIARLLRDAVELLQAELLHARLDIEERGKEGMGVIWRAGLMLVALSIVLQALAAAAILWLGQLLASYALAALLVAGLFGVVAAISWFATKKAVHRTLGSDPPEALPPGTPTLPPGQSPLRLGAERERTEEKTS